MGATPLRIGYLVQQFVPEVGAGPARVLEMTRHWQAAGADVTIITGMPNRPQGRIHPSYRGKLFVEEEVEGLRVLRSWLYASPKHGFARTILNNLTFMSTGFLNALTRGGRFDVLIASSPPFFPHISGALLGVTRRMPVILEVRDLWPDYLVEMGVLRGRVSQRLLYALESRLLRSAAHVVAVTESFRHRIERKGVDEDRITVVPNGVDSEFYYSSGEEPPIAGMRETGDFVVGYLGNFGAGQRLSTVIEAAHRIASDAPNVRFVMVGDGPDRAHVEARAAELGLRNLSIHPPITKDQTRAFHSACDISLVPLAPLPVFQDTIPSKIFEIMACERPVVAGLAGEAARIVDQSDGGIVVAPGDPEALAAGVLRLYGEESATLARMGAAGRAYVTRHYDRTALAGSYLETIANVAGGNFLPASTKSEPIVAVDARGDEAGDR
ncbi:MAG TPA: glycosyltransferase family 4 protein [Longimicrobiaceae bacterium]|nr:glycosyltransferase family 4 protein [Longimicrobiaceae bacterium]